MKHLLVTLAVLVGLAAGIGFVFYRLNDDPQLHAVAKSGDAMEWLRTDFHLNDSQFAAIMKLHEAYAPTCEEHCRMIQEATRARNSLRTTDPAAVAAAERELQELRLTCETAIAVHVRKVAELMSEQDGRRYLALVLPKVANFDHQAVPDLQLNHSH